MKTICLTLFLFIFIAACNPERWDHVDIEQLNKNGDVVCRWVDVKIIATNPGGFLSGGEAWVRFEKKDGKQISLMSAPHRFLYR